jgi:hypothetical protein
MFGLRFGGRSPVKPLILLLSAAIGLAVAAPAFAHHTHALYEPNMRIDLEGTVKEAHWINPHSWLYLIVTNDAGQEEEWALEARAPFRLAEQGWDLDAIQPGDRISVTVKPLRRGRGGLLGTIRMEDGSVFVDED